MHALLPTRSKYWSIFFVAVLEKVKEMEEQVITLDNYPGNIFNISELNNSTKESVEILKKQFGIESSPMDNCIYSSSEDDNKQKRLFYISPNIKNLIFSNPNLKVINTGVRFYDFKSPQFVSKDSNKISYRICQDGLYYLFPYVKQSVIEIDLDDLKLLLSNNTVENTQLSQKFSSLEPDYFILSCVLSHFKQLLIFFKGIMKSSVLVNKTEKDNILKLIFQYEIILKEEK